MGGIADIGDVRADATYRAISRLVSYKNDSSYEDFATNTRVLATIDRASSILAAANAPLLVAGYVIEDAIVLEVARIRSGQPALTNLDIIDLIRDVWEKLKDWAIRD